MGPTGTLNLAFCPHILQESFSCTKEKSENGSSSRRRIHVRSKDPLRIARQIEKSLNDPAPPSGGKGGKGKRGEHGNKGVRQDIIISFRLCPAI